jgi:uncharacterized protein YutE (UPF0331/DUF86 family)
MPIDRALVRQRLAQLSDYLAELTSLSELDKDAFLDKRTAASAESFLRRSLEAIFDVGRHILAKTGGTNMAREYKGIAQGLNNMGIISEPLQERLLKMAGYRNRMVHLYHQISDEELYGIIRHNLEDIRQFIKDIRNYLDTIRA